MYLQELREIIKSISPDNHIIKTKEALNIILDKLQELDDFKEDIKIEEN